MERFITNQLIVDSGRLKTVLCALKINASFLQVKMLQAGQFWQFIVVTYLIQKLQIMMNFLSKTEQRW
jgi:hypothetical protein